MSSVEGNPGREFVGGEWRDIPGYGLDLLLDKIEAFYRRFVSYPSDHARWAHVLWTVHAHCLDAFEATPRLAFLSPEPGSGKTRALEVTELLVPRPVQAVSVTPAYLFRKVGSDEGRPTILYDEIDAVFGPKAKDNEEIRAMLNAGHRRSGVAGRCVLKGNKQVTEEIPAFCAVALAGLGNLPDTILTRAIVCRMRRRAPDEQVEAFRRRVHEAEGEAIRTEIEEMAAAIEDELAAAWPELPPEIVDRDADVWEPLIAIADKAEGRWADRARVAAVALVAAAKEKSPSLGLRLLADLRTVFADHDQMPTKLILEDLAGLDEAPWGDLGGKPLDARRLSRMLQAYEIKSRTIRMETTTPKGYRREDLQDAWQRYLPPLVSQEAATSATSATTAAPSDWVPGDDF